MEYAAEEGCAGLGWELVDIGKGCLRGEESVAAQKYRGENGGELCGADQSWIVEGVHSCQGLVREILCVLSKNVFAFVSNCTIAILEL